ncbi:HAD family phosphatase [Plantactinospora sp. S1510]|uniref:HAD family phosphatase n=1 Tax=Plantactinospora alkalitolerans TaxID=2789879 RepID=A0ABS0H1V3_9ACTN|nr:HAD family phosphatase [Plantactinospora alkalitolerans]MBF9132203.1 HAD family phosphatase [Plantactinospora alkalitolerans]
MTTLRAALFDLDGVLVDTQAEVVQLWRDVCGQHGRVLSAEEIRTSVVGCSAEHTVAQLFPGLDPLERDGLLAAVHKADSSLPVVPISGAAAFVRTLAAAAVPTVLVTGASRERATEAVRALGLDGCFAALVAWGDVTRGKPHPDGYRLAARLLDLGPSQTVVFEDSVVGVTAAVAAPAFCVGIGTAELATHGARVVTSSLAAIEVAHPAGGGFVELRVGVERLRLRAVPQSNPTGEGS